ncbi:MAG TPA: PIN domain-containing protein [Candidatus Saccharimonadales bacterium]|nr:PIN domain-containing protein [Candidatus Saccharimonadales bacterium]
MKQFFDTSVLIATFFKPHVHHEASILLFASASRAHSACALHSLAELYAAMTALPVRPPIPSEQAFLFVQEVRARLTLISLEEPEYLETIQRISELGFTSGRIYDALLLRSAAKCQAQTIYTWNLKHFQALAPELSSIIRTP